MSWINRCFFTRSQPCRNECVSAASVDFVGPWWSFSWREDVSVFSQTGIRSLVASLAAVALSGASVATARADTTFTFDSPVVTTATGSDQCGSLGPDCVLIKTGGLVGGGSYDVNETLDTLNFVGWPPSNDPNAVLTGYCYPFLSPSATRLTFNTGLDVLRLSSDTSAPDAVCITRDAPMPGATAAGPFALQLRVTVDGTTSQGMYKDATGSGTLVGTWNVDPPSACVDANGQAVANCGLSGETLKLSLGKVVLTQLSLKSQDPGAGTGGVTPGATPELDSLILFGVGILGVGVVLNRRRVTRG